MYSRQPARSWTPTARSRGRRANAAKPVNTARPVDTAATDRSTIGGDRNVVPSVVLPPAKPRDHVLGVLVRREHRIEHLRDDAVVDDKSHALEQRHARGR